MRAALTGGIGSGKSSVADLLRERGALVIDADAIAREVVATGQPAISEIAEHFGSDVINDDGTLDRAALAARVFGDADELAALNAITHPRIAARTAELLAAAPPDAVVVYDMPLLVENGATTGWDLIVVVDCPDDIRVDRLVRHRGMAEADARRRIAAQADRAERLAVADVIIDNSGDPSSLRTQVDVLWRRLTGAR